MLNLKDRIEETGEHLRDYYETITELNKLKAVEKASVAFSNIAGIVAGILMIFAALVFASLTAALIISENTGHLYIGFLYVMGFYLLLGILVFAFRSRLISNPLRDMIIKSFLNEQKDN
jgi:hypothetical protein